MSTISRDQIKRRLRDVIRNPHLIRGINLRGNSKKLIHIMVGDNYCATFLVVYKFKKVMEINLSFHTKNVEQ